MGCEPKLALLVIAGFVSGTLLGFLFRQSDAERRQSMQSGFRHPVMRALSAPIWTLRGFVLLVLAVGILFLVLWAPASFLGILPLCGPDFYVHKWALIVGAFVGWFLRWLLWKRYLQFL